MASNLWQPLRRASSRCPLTAALVLQIPTSYRAFPNKVTSELIQRDGDEIITKFSTCAITWQLVCGAIPHEIMDKVGYTCIDSVTLYDHNVCFWSASRYLVAPWQPDLFYPQHVFSRSCENQGNWNGESVVAAILPSHTELSYCTLGFFRS